MDAVSRYVQAVLQDERYTEPRFVAWVDQAIAEMRDCLGDQGLELDAPGVAPAALVILMYLRQGMDEYVVQSGMAQEDVAVEALAGGMVALAHLIHQQRVATLRPLPPPAVNAPQRSAGLSALLRRGLGALRNLRHGE
jgi:hypothetical protein